MEVAFLPDDLVLEVFSHLDARQLLLARGVCRRWRDLALHSAAWAHRDLELERDGDLGLTRAVLSLAPCLSSLRFLGDSLQLLEQSMRVRTHPRVRSGVAWLRVAKAAAVTRCAVKELEMCVRSGKAVEILRNQLRLPDSRLQRCVLSTCGPDGQSPAHVFRLSNGPWLQLFQFLRQASVPELRVDVPHRYLGWPPAVFAAKRSDVAGVRKLEYLVTYWPDPMLTFLLESHATTLESVHLFCSEPSFERPLQLPASLLLGCANLRELHCPNLKDMGDLLKSTRVTRLSIETILGEFPAIDSFRSAAGITHLSFKFVSALSSDELASLRRKIPVPVEQVVALSRCGSSALQSLCFEDHFMYPEDWDRLGLALAGLPQLRTVSIRGPPSVGFLRAITPSSAPRLRHLRIDCLYSCPGDKVDWAIDVGDVRVHVHFAEVRELLRRNPQLHLSWLAFTSESCGVNLGEEGCMYSSSSSSEEEDEQRDPELWGWGCCCWHRSREQGLDRIPYGTKFGLFGHAEAESCDLHVGPLKWVRLDPEWRPVKIVRELDLSALFRT